jgi:hypothetical protein
LVALIEYEKDINLLESLYNNNKELLDQHELDTDLKELAEYAWFWFLAPRSRTGLTWWRRILRDLDEWLNLVNPNLGKKKLPSAKELWKYGDLLEKLAESNAKISSVRARWQVRGSLRFRRRTVLTVITFRCDCKCAHLREWTLLRRKRQLYSNRYSP